MKTEFFDRSGKPLYLGDTVQYRLNSSSASLLKVAKTKKGIELVNPEYARTYPNQAHRGSIPVSRKYEKYLSIVDTSERES